MGSSSHDDYDQPIPTPQTPATTPAAPPPTYPQFLPSRPGQVATGLTQNHFNQIAAGDAQQAAAVEAMFAQGSPQSGATNPAASVGSSPRDDLAAAIVLDALSRAGRGNNPGYTTSGGGYGGGSSAYGKGGLI